MKLIYIWVEKYKSLENFGFNIDSSYEVEYNIEKNKLEIIKNNIPNIFGDNILGVTALVGKNGSGKTSVLELIALENKHIEFENDRSMKYIYVYSTEVDDEYIIETNFLYLKETLKNLKRQIYKYSIKNNKKESLNERIAETSIIRYKPDLKLKEQNKSSLLSISRFNIGMDLKYSELFLNFQKKLKNLESYNNPILVIRLIENMKRYDEIKLDTLCLVKIVNGLNKDKKNEFIENFIIYNININFREIIENFIKYPSLCKDLLKIEVKILDQMFSKEDLSIIKSKILGKKKYNMKILEKTWNLLKSIKYAKGGFNKNYHDEILSDQSIKLKKILNKIKGLDSCYFSEGKITFNLKEIQTKKDQKNILNFLKEYESLPDGYSDYWELKERVTDFLYLELKNVSDGEKLFLNILCYLTEKINIFNGLEEQKRINFILLFDEIELYLHPEWSRKIFNLIITFLNEIKNCKFQIILATHTPFIISDIPKEGIILLENKNGKINAKKCEIETFGANIFDLYKNAFFVESTFGEFARKKIIELLNKESLDNLEERSEAEYLVSSIGEKLIRTQLENFLKTKSKDI